MSDPLLNGVSPRLWTTATQVGPGYQWVYDGESSMAYLTLGRHRTVADTVNVDDHTNVDLDEAGHVVGVELFSVTAPHVDWHRIALTLIHYLAENP